MKILLQILYIISSLVGGASILAFLWYAILDYNLFMMLVCLLVMASALFTLDVIEENIELTEGRERKNHDYYFLDERSVNNVIDKKCKK